MYRRCYASTALCYWAEWRFMLGSVSTQMLIYWNVFSFFLVFLGLLCGKVCVCVGDAQSSFCVCIFWKCRSWFVEPGNLGICKVSTITKAINLDTIMQSGEEEDRKKKQEKLWESAREEGEKEKAAAGMLMKWWLIITVRLWTVEPEAPAPLWCLWWMRAPSLLCQGPLTDK